MAQPTPGWYPSSDQDPQWLQYWDGEQWTSQRKPAAPEESVPLTRSGMRRISVLFSESATIARRAWRPLLGVGALLWGLWGVLVLALAPVVRFGDWVDLYVRWMNLEGVYPENEFFAAQLEQEVALLAHEIGLATWLAASALLIITTVLVSAAQYAAVLRLGAEAACGRPATFAVAVEGMRVGTVPLMGLNVIVWLVGLFTYGLTFMLPVSLASGWSILSVLFGVAFLALGLAFFGRFLPAFVQATMPGEDRPLHWSWRATEGRFRAVVGRYLVWTLTLTAASSLIMWLCSLPVFLVLIALAYASSFLPMLVAALILWAVFATLAVVSLLAYVPIWRDLTTDPDYRAIAPEREPVLQ